MNPCPRHFVPYGNFSQFCGFPEFLWKPQAHLRGQLSLVLCERVEPERRGHGRHGEMGGWGRKGVFQGLSGPKALLWGGNVSPRCELPHHGAHLAFRLPTGQEKVHRNHSMCNTRLTGHSGRACCRSMRRPAPPSSSFSLAPSFSASTSQKEAKQKQRKRHLSAWRRFSHQCSTSFFTASLSSAAARPEHQGLPAF